VILAQQQLAIALGLDDHHMISIALPADPLPDGENQPPILLDAEHLQQYIDQALTRRGDYLASKTRSSEQHALLVGNRNQLLPQVNVVGSIGYTGVRPGSGPGNYLAPLFITPSGPNASIGVQYQFPIQNRAARGGVEQNEAMLRQQDLTTSDLARQIASAVVTAANGLRLDALQLSEARRASAAALEGLEGERERLRAGVGSVLDVLQTEDRYIAAVLAEISAQVSYATAIAGFRFATGTYIDPRSPVQSVGRDAFYCATTQ
jgi:outer membrane protein